MRVIAGSPSVVRENLYKAKKRGTAAKVTQKRRYGFRRCEKRAKCQ